MQSVESTSSQASPDCLNFGDDDSDVFQSEDERSEVTGGHSRSALSSSSSGLGWSSTESDREKEKKSVRGTQGDLLVAQKCLELQGFIQPLLELLNGLKKGRFDKELRTRKLVLQATPSITGVAVGDVSGYSHIWMPLRLPGNQVHGKGLSSFQQSVAMDRIQRIIGVLQKPQIGEKYLPTLLQVEMMLKLWFPQVSLQPTGTSVSRQLSGQGPSSSSTPPHKQKDQLHIPVKKRRLSWTDAESSTPTPVACKCFHIKGQEKEKEEQSQGLSVSAVPAYHVDQSDRNSEEKSGPKGLRWAESGLTWVHITPIFSPPKSCPSLIVREGGGQDLINGHFLLRPPPPARRVSPATQDNSISSTTPCSKPLTYQIQPEMITPTEARSQSPPITEQLSSLLQT